MKGFFISYIPVVKNTESWHPTAALPMIYTVKESSHVLPHY